MANQHIPDQSSYFKSTGMRLITDPASDRLMHKASVMRREAQKVADEFIQSKVKEG